ncbi:MAG: adenylate/guanylate cyclase domain-containing protein [Pseudomonadota bacterium]
MTTARDALLSERVLNAMRDGVLAIDLTGRIIMFNEAAGALLAQNPADVLGRPFAEVFLLDERFDDFNELVLKAVYEAKVSHSQDVVLATDGGRVDLRVSSSFLTRSAEGVEERFGVVVVFSNTTEQRKRRKLKQLFGEYVDPKVLDQILRRGEEGVSRRGEMTISFVDMRNYTGWSERLGPEALTALLNRFLTAVTRPIGEAGGITDKFIGDSAMAAWGPPYSSLERQAADACRAALGQLAAVDALRETLVAEGFAGGGGLDAGVGIATGDVLSGDIGPSHARNFTVIGHAVNVAARLQDLTKAYGCRVVVSDATRRQAGEGFVFRALDRVTVRGASAPIRIHALVGISGAVPDEALDHIARYEAALTLIETGRFAEARDALSALAAEAPGDRAVAGLLDRAAAALD